MLQTDLISHSDGSGVPRDAKKRDTEPLRARLFDPKGEDISVLDAQVGLPPSKQN